ncbi:MAG: hypothetical protein KKG09_10805 [Verrucomicrobia bacterium]|nr:hypothetical protein [Verrucomicrobiota bacterium]MBU4292139.1 hypothetical protein [Verrucomicrobiota bacterium]MBU4428936.1 hypothetical protein [Verrucomicrobiota bacterium]MBU4498482.1 hypothetical protein [Verrucomicrobiota bacterium]MCG2680791.1 hypothetical protein [Kiritimatiellia bacterium]
MCGIPKLIGVGLMGMVLLALVGCAHFPGGIAASSTPLEGRKYTVLGRTEGSDNYVTLLCIIPMTSANTIRRAMDRACVKAGGDALIDVTVECHAEYWILFGLQVTTVEGTAIRFNK